MHAGKTRFEKMPQLKVRSPVNSRRSRSGYVLVMCLLVVAISSSIVLTLFNILRLQTAETLARQQLVVASALVDAAHEHALAVLIDQPSFRGTVGPISVPGFSDRNYTVTIADAADDVQLLKTGQVGLCIQSASLIITQDALDDRRDELEL